MGDELNVSPSAVPIAHIRTEAQAINWVQELIQEMLQWRQQCDVVFPGHPAKTVEHQRRAMWTFLTKQGAVTGALKTLLLCGLMSERAYKELNQQAVNTLIPSIVGTS